MLEMARKYKAENNVSNRETLGLVLSPTRELAKQTHEVLVRLLNGDETLPTLKCVGRVRTPAEDARLIRESGANFIIATPGRLEELMSMPGVINVRRLRTLILDEADLLLAMGFQTQIDSILSQLPKQRRTGLFSATQSTGDDVKNLIKAGLRNPVFINATQSWQLRDQDGSGSSTADSASALAVPQGLSHQWVACTPVRHKLALLVQLLRPTLKKEKTLVFFLTCASVEYFYNMLDTLNVFRQKKNKRLLFKINGHMTQRQRETALQQFEQAGSGVMFCTDVVSRGVDFPDLDCVVSFDLPRDAEKMVHRMGRTARAGRTGRALTMLFPHEEDYLELMRNRGIPSHEFDASSLTARIKKEADNLLRRMRQAQFNDRAHLESGTRAFLSFLQGYQQHTYKHVQNVRRLNLGQVAMYYALLYLPRSADIRFGQLNLADFEAPEKKIDTSKIAFRDKTREERRQKGLGQRQEKKEKEIRARIEKREAAQKSRKQREKERRRLKRSKTAAQQVEWDDLAAETRLLKKLRRGKISQEKFDELFN
ncbi:MAG: hypothetical protein MHM6MM_008534 [Cercozoa sp. M6MM]